MKKIFALILMSLAVCVNANAQWHRNYFKADELMEVEEHYNNVYEYDGNFFICWSSCNAIGVGSLKNFDVNGFARVGFYKDGKLIDMEKYVSIKRHKYIKSGDLAYIGYEDEDLGYKIIHHLKYIGNIRIVVPLYNSTINFDITIPMNPNIKTYIPKEEPQKPEPIVEVVPETPKEEKTDTLTIAELWKSLDTLEVFKRPTTDEIWEDFKKATTNKQEIVIQQPKIEEPKTDEIWKSYENAVRYIKYNDASYLETTYFRIENLLYANKREMRSLPKDSNERKLKKQQIKIMKSKMEEIDNKYFELTNKYIYQG